LAFLELRSNGIIATGIMVSRNRRVLIILPKPEQCQIFTSGLAPK